MTCEDLEGKVGGKERTDGMDESRIAQSRARRKKMVATIARDEISMRRAIVDNSPFRQKRQAIQKK